MRSKTAAGLFALFLGWAGVHRFYLGQVGLGILYVFLTAVSYTHLRAHETVLDLVCRLLLEKKKIYKF